ncbi:MAG: hypothetical protein KC668_28100 [Myxococcales bacterium]|nr:hypothetical protein [Myxococcales bacterium]
MVRLRITDAMQRNHGVELEFIDVSDLRIQGFGGGLTQLMCLRVSDVSELGYDRVRYAVQDLEDGRLALKCDEIVCVAQLGV